VRSRGEDEAEEVDEDEEKTTMSKNEVFRRHRRRHLLFLFSRLHTNTHQQSCHITGGQCSSFLLVHSVAVEKRRRNEQRFVFFLSFFLSSRSFARELTEDKREQYHWQLPNHQVQ
jgi:hypothetical protein